jgi:hypothetical protein
MRMNSIKNIHGAIILGNIGLIVGLCYALAYSFSRGFNKWEVLVAFIPVFGMAALGIRMGYRGYRYGYPPEAWYPRAASVLGWVGLLWVGWLLMRR